MLVHELGAYQFEITGLNSPADAIFDSNGQILVADEAGNQIKVFDAEGRRIKTWGRRGTAPGDLQRPSGIALSTDGELFVADSGNHRIQVFKPDGTFERAWGEFGTDHGQFNTPTRVAVSDARIYVVDQGNHRIEVFDREAIHQLTIGRYGTGDGEFRRPTGVAVDVAGNVYVADGDNARVQRFDANGKFIKAWSQWGPYPGFMMNPANLRIQSGRVYVADSDNHRIHVFDVDGQFLYRFGVHAVRPREGAGRLHYPTSVAISPDGTKAVVCEFFENRCQIFGVMTPDTPKDPLANAGLDLTLVSHYGQRADVDGHLMAITEPESHSVLVFDLTSSEPVLITQIGTYGKKPGEFIRPTDTKLDTAHSMLYVCDAGNRRIQTFKLNPPSPDNLRYDPFMAKFVSAIDLPARIKEHSDTQRNSADIEPTAIDHDDSGNTYILDAVYRRMWRFDDRWHPTASWGHFGAEESDWLRPTDMIWHKQTRAVWIVDADRRCAFAYDGDGKLIETLKPRADLGMIEPFGIAIDDKDNAYLTDAGKDRIFKYDGKGQFKKHWGGRGLGAGEMFRPTSIHLDDKGRLIVIDFGNHRGAYFSTDGEYLNVFGSRFFTAPARRKGSTH